MLSSNTLSVPKNSLIPQLVLTLVIWLAVFLPILISGSAGIFYSTDPDVVYVANALSYIKQGQINYIDHPGTPTIRLIATSLWPLRIYAKLARQPFVWWTTLHFSELYLYLRLFQSLVFATSVFVFLSAIKKQTNHLMPLLFGALALFTFSFLPYLGAAIIPETTSFLFISIWLFIFTYFCKERSPILLPVLSLVAGLTLANKFSNLFLVLGSLSLVLSLDLTRRQKIANLIFNTLVMAVGFIFGTWPIHNHYPLMFAWIVRLFTTTQIHGNGDIAIFNFDAYRLSFLTLINLERTAVLVTFAVLALFLINILKRAQKAMVALVVLLISSLLGIVVFAKYPLSHYQLANFLVIVFLGSICLEKVRLPLQILICSTLLLLVPPVLNNYYTQITNAIGDSRNLETYLRQNPSDKPVVWEWARVSDYAMLWTRSWGNNVNGPELKILKPNLWELKTGFKYIVLSDTDIREVSSACWDKLYIQKVSAPTFLMLYPNKSLYYQAITGTSMGVITSLHCETTRP